MSWSGRIAQPFVAVLNIWRCNFMLFWTTRFIQVERHLHLNSIDDVAIKSREQQPCTKGYPHTLKFRGVREGLLTDKIESAKRPITHDMALGQILWHRQNVAVNRKNSPFNQLTLNYTHKFQWWRGRVNVDFDIQPPSYAHPESFSCLQLSFANRHTSSCPVIQNNRS